jgi:hypothetical protein
MLHTRGSRVTFVLLLVAAAIGAGLVVWAAEQRRALLATSERAASEQVDLLVRLAAGLDASIERPATSGLQDETWTAQVERQIQRFDQATGRLALEDTPLVAPAVAELKGATRAFEQTIARVARTDSADGASPGDTAPSIGLSVSVQRLRQAQYLAFSHERAVLADRSWSALGAATAAWAIGLALLARWPLRRESDVEVAHQAPLLTIDLDAISRVCGAIATVTAADQLPGLLRETALAVGARGLILWTPYDGQLIAVASHGYEPRAVQRFGATPLAEANPVTTAWHSGTAAAVAATATAPAALAVPLPGPNGRVGVLAIELRPGREFDAATKAVVSIIAAQLGAVVGPASGDPRSVTEPTAAPPELARAIGA